MGQSDGTGRNILTPQAQSSLKTTLDQVFKNTPKSKLAAIGIDDVEQSKLLEAVSHLATVTAPLSGLTSHLLTLNEGAHFKPLVRQPNERPKTINAAVTADPADPKSPLKDLIDGRINPQPAAIFQAVDGSSSSTPYAASVSGPLYQFPVTHGQFIFTKLNIVDKFGQVVPCLDPAHRASPKQAIDPITSEYMFCESIGPDDKGHFRPNTVIDQEIGITRRSNYHTLNSSSPRRSPEL